MRPFDHYVSLGSHCFVAETLRRQGLRQRSLPFDWLFSSPQIVARCLRDDFTSLIAPENLHAFPVAERGHPAFGFATNIRYRTDFGFEPPIFNHQDPTTEAGREQMDRRIAAMREILAAPTSKLLILVCNHPGNHDHMFDDVASAVQAHTTNARLVYVHVFPPTGRDRPQMQEVPSPAGSVRIDMHPVGNLGAVAFEVESDDAAIVTLIEDQTTG